MDIHPGKVFAFYSVYLTNWEELPFFDNFYPGRVYNFLENIHPCILDEFHVLDEEHRVDQMRHYNEIHQHLMKFLDHVDILTLINHWTFKASYLGI